MQIRAQQRATAETAHPHPRRGKPTTTAERKYRKGDRVRFRMGTRWVHGTVTEDRGPIGVGGRRLYGVPFRPATESAPSYVELPAEDLRPAPAAAAAR